VPRVHSGEHFQIFLVFCDVFWTGGNALAFIVRLPYVFGLQSYLAGLAASGAITSVLRLITKAAFESSQDGLRKGASMPPFFQHI
jgi:hypothetical protein